MAKIFAKKYQKMIDNGEVTLQEACILVADEVPQRWMDDVLSILRQNNL